MLLTNEESNPLFVKIKSLTTNVDNSAIDGLSPGCHCAASQTAGGGADGEDPLVHVAAALRPIDPDQLVLVHHPVLHPAAERAAIVREIENDVP